MKKAYLILSLAAILFLISSCAPKQQAINSEMETWLLNAHLDAKDTPEELYEKALTEDTLVIYSSSTRVMDVKDSFEKQYPGLTVYVQDTRSVDLVDVLKQEFLDGQYHCDIVLCSDDNGVISQELIPEGIVYKYVPYDIADKIRPENDTAILPMVEEIEMAFYNSEVYSAPPVNNWWELTEERFYGGVVMPNPTKSFSAMGLVGMTLKNSDVMALAYRELYGRDLALKDGETAGEAYWRMLMENGLILVNSSDEVVEFVGTPGLSDPPIGIMVSSKLRMRDVGFYIEPIYDMRNFCGTYTPNSIMIAGGSKNINAAKLFIRWILGETDGQGEGSKPYLQKGAWSVRTDVQSNANVSLDALEYFQLDPEYIYDNLDDITAYWLTLMDTEQRP